MTTGATALLHRERSLGTAATVPDQATLLRPDAFLVDRTGRKATTIEFTFPDDANLGRKVREKRSKYELWLTPHPTPRRAHPRRDRAALRSRPTTVALCAPSPSSRRRCMRDRTAVHGRQPHRARHGLTSIKPSLRARQGGRHPLGGRELLHLQAAPRQHRRCAARRNCTRRAGRAVSTRRAHGGHGRGHGDDDG